MISEALTFVFKSGRETFNAKFKDARRRFPDLDAAAFQDFLSTTLDPVVRRADRLSSHQLTTVIQAAYDAGLQLVGERLAGPGARRRTVEEGWIQILPSAQSLVATAPERALAAISNALNTLSSTPDVRAAEWSKKMAGLASACGDLDTWLKLGQVLAWTCGMAHLRRGALEIAQSLPDALALAVLDAPPGSSWPALLQRLQSDVWFNPAASLPAPLPGLRVAARAGAFRGFGGKFSQPPLVASLGDHLIVKSGEAHWLLVSDVFGSTLHHATPEEFKLGYPGGNLPKELKLDRTHLSWRNQSQPIPVDGEVTSAAAIPGTLALTSTLTHAITLVAL